MARLTHQVEIVRESFADLGLFLAALRAMATYQRAAIVAGTYVSMGLQPAMQTLIRSVGGNGLWLVVTLRRIVEAADLPATADGAAHVHLKSPRRPRPGGSVLELHGVTFAYGPHADPVIHDLDLLLPDDDHLAVVGPSGVGKSTLAGIEALDAAGHPPGAADLLGALPRPGGALQPVETRG